MDDVFQVAELHSKSIGTVRLGSAVCRFRLGSNEQLPNIQLRFRAIDSDAGRWDITRYSQTVEERIDQKSAGRAKGPVQAIVSANPGMNGSAAKCALIDQVSDSQQIKRIEALLPNIVQPVLQPIHTTFRNPGPCAASFTHEPNLVRSHLDTTRRVVGDEQERHR